jgi:hypothetical protein
MAVNPGCLPHSVTIIRDIGIALVESSRHRDVHGGRIWKQTGGGYRTSHCGAPLEENGAAGAPLHDPGRDLCGRGKPPAGEYAQEITRETIVEADEIVSAVLLPQLLRGLRSSYRKVRARGSWDFSLAGAALALRLNENKVVGAKVVLSGAAPIPWRCPDAERVIMGQTLNEAVIAQAAAAAMKAAMLLRQNEYKIELFKGLLTEELAADA